MRLGEGKKVRSSQPATDGTGVNINFIPNASEDASDKNLLMDVPEKHTGFTHIALEITDRQEVVAPAVGGYRENPLIPHPLLPGGCSHRVRQRPGDRNRHLRGGNHPRPVRQLFSLATRSRPTVWGHWLSLTTWGSATISS